MPTFAAVDIGANSVRLKIARLTGSRLQVVHVDREVTRLGEAVFAGGALAPEAMQHTVEVLRRFHRAVQRYAAERVRVAATSALRDARNAPVFAEWVRSATGWPVKIISGLEEGRLIHLGVIAAGRIKAARVLLFDLGGGSCEVTLSNHGHIESMVSVPLGAMRLTRVFLEHDPPKKKELAQMREFIAKELRRVERRVLAADVQVAVATSGTAAALHDLWVKREKRSPAEARVVPTPVVAELAKQLARLPLAGRRALPGINARRAEIIVAGAHVFAELLTRWELPGFRYLPLGLRDGILAEMGAVYGHASALQEQIATERRDAVRALARHYGVDLKHALQVRHLAQRLFRGLRPIHGLPADYEESLAAAAMLYEVGALVNRAGRHRHAHYIIAHSEILGFSASERRRVAAIARYMGKSLPRVEDRALQLVAREDRPLIPKAVALLRLAVALDQSRRASVLAATPRVERERVRLRLSTRGSADLELWAAAREAPYFREVFGRELELTTS